MKVTLKAITKPVDDSQSIEDFIAYVARVSNPSNQDNKTTAKKLLKYLRDNSHWSPFEMASITMEIKTTRDIGRQILRHVSFRFQEFSQRYADPTQMEFEFRDARLQDKKNRQNSIETNDDWLQKEWVGYQHQVMLVSLAAYDWAVEHGIAKEQARVVLPEGMTPSMMYMAGTIRSWIHYCQLRMANGTQKEHMEIAQACWKIVLEHFPSLNDIPEPVWDEVRTELKNDEADS